MLVFNMRLYFMGICGTAMGNAALMLRSLGHDVCGADTGIYPPMSDLLKQSGIPLYEGYDAARLQSLQPDLVVVGNVTSRGHPEMEWLLDSRAFRYTSLPALLSELILCKRKNIVIAGTHGKTTTSTLTAWLLTQHASTPPGYLIGGVPRDLPSGASSGEDGSAFVIEGDEYDSAFFDKRSKFIHYLPNILVLNNLEFDHADIFRDLEDVKRTFRHVIRLVPSSGKIIANGEDENLASLLPVSWTSLHTVGSAEAGDFDLQIADFREDATGAQFDLIWQGKLWAHIAWSLPGLFNARNAAHAALAAGLMLHPEDPTRLSPTLLSRFQGIKRRQEVLCKSDRVQVIEDFGHHPSAIRETLRSLRCRYPDWCIHACFEPRSNTARLRIFQQALVEAFADANHVYLGAVHRSESIAHDQRLDTKTLGADIAAQYPSIQARAFAENHALYEALLTATQGEASKREHLVIFFSNGSFEGIIPRFAASVAKPPPVL